MNIRTEFKRVAPAELQPLRCRYLAELTHGQEASIEVLVPDAAGYHILHRGLPVGYCLISGGDALIELYLEQAYWVFGERIVQQLCGRLAVQRAFVKTFDALMLASCLPLHTKVRVAGIMSRDYVPRALPEHAALQVVGRQATLADFSALWAVEQEVFRSEARLRWVVEQGFVYLYFNGGCLVGFGILRPVVSTRSEVELGFAVDRPYRLRGVAPYILRDLADRVLSAGKVPVAACAAENKVSRQTAERIGFVSRYQLLEITFGTPP